jgi:hypothetical protein
VLVHRAGQTVVLDAQMRHLGEVQEPAGLTDALLLGFS